ncbi:class I SAM-dependent methyltransferase [Methylopila henanensis]|uniref:Class I SAM-dependent methyltransferase n=1 Tax=Methylopila henanensis TaxID=873516 RepID=A0ABW4K817_9HYPH
MSRTRRPPCPVTGEPASRLVQWVSAELLADLWRYEFRVDVRPSFRGATRFGLWESPTGLHFFDPMTAGDAAFYDRVYARMRLDRHRDKGPKAEFAMAAQSVAPGDRVLDVGCGFGAFRASVPHADYVGLEPYGGADRPPYVLAETLDGHLATNAGAYDLTCAFQVLEHVERPLAMLRGMAAAVRPGGQVIVGVPHVPSAGARIPNYLINATPHHLTWWTEAALRAAAERAGLVDARVEQAPWSDVDAIVYWIARCSPIRCVDRRYRHAWSWHAASAVGFLAGYAMWTLRGAPRAADDEGASLLLTARKPD